MKLFTCTNCQHLIFFENDHCGNCQNILGFNYKTLDITSVPQSNNTPQQFFVGDMAYKYCSNHQLNACNWLVSENSDSEFCVACSLNNIIPNISDVQNYLKWQKLEIAKHRLVYDLLRLELPIKSKLDYPEDGLYFDFISNADISSSNQKRMTGHADGVITLLLAEADSVHREKIRKQLSEPYRTLIGHFRHEVGHYYWDVLVKTNPEILQSYRNLFGDERLSYNDALKTYYKKDKNINWSDQYISSYASAHPWEDWAETWAHYIHIMDTMEMANAMGISLQSRDQNNVLQMSANYNPFLEQNFSNIIKDSATLFVSLNSLNRGMGIQDIYPFIISPLVIKKMEFIHQLLYNLRKSN